MYAGTGDAQRLNARVKGTNNLMIGIKDPDYPFYKSIATPKNADDISRKELETGLQTGDYKLFTYKDSACVTGYTKNSIRIGLGGGKMNEVKK